MRLALVCAFCLLASASPSWSVTLNSEGCGLYAVWSGSVVWARQVGADREKVRVSLVELNDDDTSGAIGLVLKDVDKLWATSAPWASVMQIVYRDCIRRRGVYGTGA